MKAKKWLSALLVAVMAVTAAPAVGAQAADGCSVTVNGDFGTVEVGDVTNFSVTTSGTYDSGKVVGEFAVEGNANAVNVEYYENATGYEGWYSLPLGTSFGPAGGFNYVSGAESEFRVTFTEAGKYKFTINIVDVNNREVVATGTQEVIVAERPAADIEITDRGLFENPDFGEDAYSVGWKYTNGFDMGAITSIRVGMMDKHDRMIIEYTADKDQVDWQQGNGYVTAEGLSSAPFYKEYKGTPIVEGRDDDWTVTFGKGFNTWQPSMFYVEVIANGTVYYKTISYEYDFPCVHEFVTHVPAKAATCTEDGNIEYWRCDDCGTCFSDEELTNAIDLNETIVKATGHQVVKVEAKAPTADKAGNIAYWYCEKCGKYFSDEALTKEISKEDTVVAATGAKAADEKKAGEVKAARTGDTTNVLVWGVLAVVAAGAVAVGVKKRAK